MLRRGAALRERSEPLVAECSQRRDLLVRLGDAPADARVAGDTALLRQRAQVVDRLLRHRDGLQPESATLVRQRAHRDAPTVVEPADEIRGRHLDIREEDFGEVLGTGEVLERTNVDAGRVHVDDQHADALVLGHVGIGPDVAEAFLGDHRVRRPDLLAVHDERAVAPILKGARRERGKVAAGVRLAHADAPHEIAADRRRGELPLLLVAELEQAGRGDRVTREVKAARDAALREFLHVDQRLDGCCVATPELRRVRGNHPPVVEERCLPLPGPQRDLEAAAFREVAARFRLGRRALLDEFDQLSAECLVARAPLQLHAGWSASAR